MAKVQVFLHGQLLSELLLTPGQDYYAGRSSQCHILLANERGISRQHIKFLREGDDWVALITAKYGTMIFDGESVEKVILKGEVRFSVPPYEFLYTDDTASVNHDVSKPAEYIQNEPMEQHTPSTVPPVQADTAHAQPETPAQPINEESAKLEIETKEPTRIEGNFDATVAGVSQLVAYLKIYNNKVKTEEILKLEGHVWIAGRHPSCDIVVNDSAFSRKHFDITKSSEGYFVTDHNSSNGTLINGEKIEASTPTKIMSGDIITVKHIEFVFELHDGEYKNKIDDLPVLENSEVISTTEDMHHAHAGHALAPYNGDGANGIPAMYDSDGAEHVLRIPPANENKNGGFKPNKIHFIIGILALVLVYGMFSGNNPPAPSGSNTTSADSPSVTPSKELTPDKQKEVSDTFNLAQNYYMQRKFVMCISQVEKLHSIVPFYNNSKELDSLCRQAQELEQLELDRKRKEDERVAAENKIRSTVEECKKNITEKTTSEELNLCLQPASELDPQNGLIVELQTQIALKEAQIKEKQDKAVEFAERKQAGTALFNKAVAHYKEGKLKLALQEFKSFLSGRYPGLNQKEDAAQRNIASIEDQLGKMLNEKISVCQSALDRADLKTAVKSCDDVLKEEPKNEKAQEIRNKAFSQLKKDMKALYDDAALEESLGNIEAAKEKWSKILDTSIPKEDYYQKAKKKLSKYGIGN